MNCHRLFLLAVLLAVSPAAAHASDLRVFGYLEKVRLGPDDLLIRAKLDTGADTSSLGYEKLEYFDKGGVKWVRIVVRNAAGISSTIERRVVRISSIKRHNTSSIQRPVVRVSLCLGDIHRMTEVSLADRSGFSIPVLIGRSFLSGIAVVDSSREYTTDPQCDKGKL